jgi:hypothetical protein
MLPKPARDAVRIEHAKRIFEERRLLLVDAD